MMKPTRQSAAISRAPSPIRRTLKILLILVFLSAWFPVAMSGQDAEPSEPPTEEEPATEPGAAPAEEGSADDPGDIPAEEEPVAEPSAVPVAEEPADDSGDIPAEEEPVAEPSAAPAEEGSADDSGDIPAEEEPVAEPSAAPVAEEPADDSGDIPAEVGPAVAAAAEDPDNEEPPVPEKTPTIDAYHSVDGLEHWRYEYDVTKYKKGRYNLIIQGTDLAGNTYVEGPYNIEIDPESDLPVTSISNPTPEMRVGGNLNMVGTCVDDDQVSKVEVKINDGEYKEVMGTDFWSYNLSTEDLPDGAYTIYARGTDINGVVGRDRQVVFNLDRYKPVFEFTSHQNGDMVNRIINLTGNVSDPNGIASLSYSTDGGQIYETLPFRGDRQAASVTFQVRIDTTKLPPSK